MALAAERVARLFRSALGAVIAERRADIARGRGSAGTGVSAIARRLYDRDRNVPGTSYSSYAAVVRRADQAARAAEAMNNDASRAPAKSELPEVPTLYDSDRRYRYDVITTVHRPGRPERVVRGEVVSDTPLSGAEVEDRVRQRTDYNDSPFRARKNPLNKVSGSDVIVSVEILAATRVY